MTSAPISHEPASQPPVAADAGERLAVVARLTAAARAELGQRSDEVSLRAVARRAGIDPRAVMSYLDSREQLIANVVLEIAFDIHHALRPAVEGSVGAPARARLLEVAHVFRRWALANPGDYWTLMGPRKSYASDRASLIRALRWFYGPVFDICREGVENGQIDLSAAVGVERTVHLVHPVFGNVADDPRVVTQAISFMSGLHGYLVLEACGQMLAAVFTDVDQAYDVHVRTLLDAAGVA